MSKFFKKAEISGHSASAKDVRRGYARGSGSGSVRATATEGECKLPIPTKPITISKRCRYPFRNPRRSQSEETHGQSYRFDTNTGRHRPNPGRRLPDGNATAYRGARPLLRCVVAARYLPLCSIIIKRLRHPTEDDAIATRFNSSKRQV